MNGAPRNPTSRLISEVRPNQIVSDPACVLWQDGPDGMFHMSIRYAVFHIVRAVAYRTFTSNKGSSLKNEVVRSTHECSVCHIQNKQAGMEQHRQVCRNKSVCIYHNKYHTVTKKEQSFS